MNTRGARTGAGAPEVAETLRPSVSGPGSVGLLDSDAGPTGAGHRSRGTAGLGKARPEDLADGTGAPDAGTGPQARASRGRTGAPGGRGRAGLRLVRAHLGTVAGTAIMAVLLWRLGTGVFLDGLRRVDGPALLLGLGLGLLTTVFSAWRWRLVARGLGLRLPLGAAVADYYRALFLNAALPGGVLGDVHRAVRHGQSAGDLGRGVRAVVLERTAGQAVLVVFGAAVLLTQPSPVLEQARHLTGLLAPAALGALAVLAAVRMGRTPGSSSRRRAVRAALAEARQALLGRGSRSGVLVSSTVVLAGHLAMFLLAARVAGSTASAAELLPLALLALLAMGLPLNIGGWGPREGVTAWAFGAAGLGASTGLTVAVVYGVLSFVAALPGVLVLVVRWYAGVRRPGGHSFASRAATVAPARPLAEPHPSPAVTGTSTGPESVPPLAGVSAVLVGEPVPAGARSAREAGPVRVASAVPDLVPPGVRDAGSGATAVRPAPVTGPARPVPSYEPTGPSRTPGAVPATAVRGAAPVAVPGAGHLRGHPVSPAPFPRSPPARPKPAARHGRRRSAAVSPGSTASEVSREKYASKESASSASSAFPFSAEASEGRPMTPDSV